MQVTLNINGQDVSRDVEPRTLLVYFLREALELTGTHVGCDSSSCGVCVVVLDGTRAVKACTMFAVQADGHAITTVEGLAQGGSLHPLQQAFWDTHGLQCGYCTPGMLMSATALLRENPHPSDEEIKKALQGNICRCTGYWNIFEAVKAASE